jgi:hypothetical protein
VILSHDAHPHVPQRSSQTDEHARRPTVRSVAAGRRALSRIALEIVIGFIGVYAAFALGAYKERRDLVDRRHQIKRALIAEIRPIVEVSANNVAGYEKALAEFEASVKAGRPAPQPFIESVALNDHVWEATKQAGGLDLIDVPTFVALSQFYNMNSNMLAQYAQLRDFSIAEILPRQAGGPRAFFEPGTSNERASFVIYRRALSRLANMSRSLRSGGDTLLLTLARDTL